MNKSTSNSQNIHTKTGKTPSFFITKRFSVAERVGFEPTVGCPITSFQDWLLKPLGHLSRYRKTANRRFFCGGVRGI